MSTAAPKFRHSQETRDAVIRDYQAGHKVKDIAARYGVGTESIRIWARRAGVDRQGNIYRGRCPICSAARVCDDGFCRPCGADLELTGGRWVPRRGIVVWQPEMDVAS